MVNIKKIFDLIKKDAMTKQSILLFSANFIFQALNFFYHFAMGRLLGPADYGILGVLFSITYLLLAPVNTIQTILTKYTSNFLAEKRLGAIKSLFSRSLKKIFTYSVVTFAAFLGISYWLSNFLNIPNIWYLVLFSTFFLVGFIVALVRGFLQGLQKFKWLSFNLLAEGVTKLLLGLVLVLIGFKLYGAITAITLSLFLAFVLAFVYLNNKMKSWKAETIDYAGIYKYSFYVLAAMLLVTSLYTVDVILVKHYFDSISAGHYAAASVLAKVIFFATWAISWVMFPKAAEAFAKKEDHLKIFKKAFYFVLFLSVAGTAVYFLFPKFVINLLFGSQYIDVAPIIGLFALAMALFSISFVVINYYLSINKTKFVWFLIIFNILEIGLLVLFHDSLLQVVQVITLVMAGLLVSLFFTR